MSFRGTDLQDGEKERGVKLLLQHSFQITVGSQPYTLEKARQSTICQTVLRQVCQGNPTKTFERDHIIHVCSIGWRSTRESSAWPILRNGLPSCCWPSLCSLPLSTSSARLPCSSLTSRRT